MTIPTAAQPPATNAFRSMSPPFAADHTPPLPGTLPSPALLNNRSPEMEVDAAVRRRCRRHDEADEGQDFEDPEHDPRDRHSLARLGSAGAIDLAIRDESEDQRQDRDDREEHEEEDADDPEHHRRDRKPVGRLRPDTVM